MSIRRTSITVVASLLVLLLFSAIPALAQEGQEAQGNDAVQNVFNRFLDQQQNTAPDQPADQPTDQPADQNTQTDQPLPDQPMGDDPAVAEDPYADPNADPYVDPNADPYADPNADPYADPYADEGYVDPMDVFLEEKAAIDATANPATQGETLKTILELFFTHAQQDAGEEVQISHGPITLDGPMGKLAITDLVMHNVAEGETFSIQSASLENYEYLEGSLNKARFVMTGVTFDSPEDSFNEAVDTMRALGYENTSVDIVMDYVSDAATNTFYLNELSIGSPFVADMTLSFTLGNLNLSQAEEAMNNPFAITIHNARLQYLDHSLMHKVFEQAAADEGKTVDAFKQEGIQELDMQFAQAQQSGDQATIMVVEAIKSFIMNPDRLTIELAPAQPLPVAMFLGLQDPAQAIQQLGLSITTE